MNKILVIEGPPASGKSTLAKILMSRLNGKIVVYKAFGPVNFLLKIIKYKKYFKKQDLRRRDLLWEVPLIYWKKIEFLIFLFELIYKLFQQFIILLFCLKRRIIIDEFIIIRSANYFNLFVNKRLSERNFRILYSLDLTFLRILSKLFGVLYIYLNIELSELIRRWHRRGHNTLYDIYFLAIINYFYRYFIQFFRLYKISIKIINK